MGYFASYSATKWSKAAWAASLAEKGGHSIRVIALGRDAPPRDPAAPPYVAAQMAAVQSARLFPFMQADVDAGCRWPGMGGNDRTRLWSDQNAICPADDADSAILNSPPYEPTETYRMLTLFKPMLNARRVVASVEAPSFFPGGPGPIALK